MNAIDQARLLAWFSFALGALELAVPSAMSRNLGLPGGAALVRGFGLREVIAGAAIMGKPDSPLGPWSRVAGDVMDLAVLASALGPRNRHRGAAAVATILVAGVTALDLACAIALTQRTPRALATARRPATCPRRPHRGSRPAPACGKRDEPNAGSWAAPEPAAPSLVDPHTA